MAFYISSSSPLMFDRWIYCNRTATGPVRIGMQRTHDWLRYAENRPNKRNSRTHQDGLEHAQANS
jgi:hypothetical protein